jgi:hypothetical protein
MEESSTSMDLKTLGAESHCGLLDLIRILKLISLLKELLA